MSLCGEMVSMHERDSSNDKPCVLPRGHAGDCSPWPIEDTHKDKDTHSKIMEYGLRQLEWDGEDREIDPPFASANRATKRHNREIVIAYEMGLTARKER